MYAHGYRLFRFKHVLIYLFIFFFTHPITYITYDFLLCSVSPVLYTCTTIFNKKNIKFIKFALLKSKKYVYQLLNFPFKKQVLIYVLVLVLTKESRVIIEFLHNVATGLCTWVEQIHFG